MTPPASGPREAGSTNSSFDGWRLSAGRLAVAVGLAAIAGFAAMQPASRTLDLRGLDYLLPVRHQLFGALFPPEKSDVVVVALDEQTYRTEPFVDTPRLAWTPYLGYVLGAVTGAQPKAIGFSDVYSTSLDRPDLLLGFDRPFLLALRDAATRSSLVMGETAFAGHNTAPSPGQVLAAEGQDNVRPLNLPAESDDVVRRYASSFATQDGGRIPSFGAELARRAGARPPKSDFIINFNTGVGDVPVYSMVDLLACAQAGKGDYFRRAFAGKVVLFGDILDVENRHRSTRRLEWDEKASAQAAPPRCAIAPDRDDYPAIFTGQSMPGVLIHAAAINTLLKGLALHEMSAPFRFAVLGISTLLLTLAFSLVGRKGGLLIASAAAALTLAFATAALQARLVAPAMSLIVATAISYTLINGYGLAIERRGWRLGLPRRAPKPEGYWTGVMKRAWAEARRHTGLETGSRIAQLLLINLTISAGLWVALGHVLEKPAIWTRALTAAAPFLLLPFYFLYRLLRVPAVASAQAQAQIDALKEELELARNPASARPDATFREALVHVTTGHWASEWDSRRPPAPEALEAAVESLESAAYAGELTIWGRSNPQARHSKIPPEYWELGAVDRRSAFQTGGEARTKRKSADGQRQFLDLRVVRRDVERQKFH